MAYDAALESYEKFEFTDGPYTRPVYRKGSGPAVIIIHLVLGLHPLVLRFADHVAEAGMTVFCPSLFGTPGKPVSRNYALSSMLGAICIRREFHVWSTQSSSPIVEWLRALARSAHAECGGKGVGAVGMCFTGGFALAMMTEPSVVAPVLSQPSMPIAAGSKKRAAGLDASPKEDRLRQTACFDAAEDLTMLALALQERRAGAGRPFRHLERRDLGGRVETIELDDADAAPADIPPHSVLTLHLRPEGPSKAAEMRVIQFFKDRTGA